MTRSWTRIAAGVALTQVLFIWQLEKIKQTKSNKFSIIVNEEREKKNWNENLKNVDHPMKYEQLW